MSSSDIVPYGGDDGITEKKLSIVPLHVLKDKRKQRRRKQRETYGWLISRCNQQIIKSNGIGCMDTMFDIPEMYYGNPRIDVREAAKFIIKQLKREGYIARYQEPGNIYISWKVPKTTYRNTASVSQLKCTTVPTNNISAQPPHIVCPEEEWKRRDPVTYQNNSKDTTKKNMNKNIRERHENARPNYESDTSTFCGIPSAKFYDSSVSVSDFEEDLDPSSFDDLDKLMNNSNKKTDTEADSDSASMY